MVDLNYPFFTLFMKVTRTFILFDICWIDELMAVTGDVGGRVLIKAHPERIKRF